MINRITIAAISCLVVGGCSLLGNDDVSDNIQFQAEKDVYSPNDTVTVRLANNSDQGLRYNLCFSTLQRSTSTGWQQVDRETDKWCEAALYPLSSGHDAAYEHVLPSKIAQGNYRFSTEVFEDDDGERAPGEGGQEIYTDAFEIVSGSE